MKYTTTFNLILQSDSALHGMRTQFFFCRVIIVQTRVILLMFKNQFLKVIVVFPTSCQLCMGNQATSTLNNCLLIPGNY